MVDIVNEARAMLLQFARSPLKDLYLRTDAVTMFMARAQGGPNPMRGAKNAPLAAVAPHASPAVAVVAPHLGLFTPSVSIGDHVPAGGVLGTLDVLGRTTDVISDSAGVVAAIHFAANDLVEFGEALVDVALAH